MQSSHTDESGPSPQKALNANAKAFQPKLDGTGEGAIVPPVPQRQPPSTPPTHPRISTQVPLHPIQMAPPLLNPMMFNGGGLVRTPQPTVPLPFGAVPPSPMFFAPPPSPSVMVGNASLAALRSKEPPKFSCVLLVGPPSSGKTTIGREAVASLSVDGMSWSFFSGGDHLKDAERRPTFWESTKEVFDALSTRLDQLLAGQGAAETRIKGLIIDKNCRGVEDILYVASLLKTKGLQLTGVVGIEVKDEDVLYRRMGGGGEEKLKFHRVIQARIVEAARSAGLYRAVDGTKSKEVVAQSVRTMVLGCSAQPSHQIRSLNWSAYSDASSPVVDCYVEYCRVMTTLFSLIKPATGIAQWWENKFPGFTDYNPLSTRELEDQNRIAQLRQHYSIRRKIDGVKYVCIYDGTGLYLVPRHMKSILRLSQEVWLGMPIASLGRFILDGELVRMTKDRSKEKFLVYDVMYWSESSNPSTNLVRMASWKERQERLASSICHEASAFFQKTAECIVVYQRSESWDKALELLEPLDYPSDGLIFQPHQNAQPTYMWRPPQAITCDLRLGALVSTSQPEPQTPATPDKMGARQSSSNFVEHQQPIKVYHVEAYDKYAKGYARLAGETVEVRRNDVVEGCFVICGLTFENNGDHHWTFHRARYDVSHAAFKTFVDDLVQCCLIARARLVQWLISEKFVSPSTQKENLLGSASGAAEAGEATSTSRGAFGSALEAPVKTQVKKDVPKVAEVAVSQPQSNLALLQRLVPTTKVQTTVKPRAQPDLSMLEAVVGSTVNIVRAAEVIPRDVRPKESDVERQRNTRTKEHDTCGECKKQKRSEDLRLDEKDGRRYCYVCWAQAGTEFCADCGEFRKGYREASRRAAGSFYCNECWETFLKKPTKPQKETKQQSVSVKTEPAAKPEPTDSNVVTVGGDNGTQVETEKKRRRRGGRGRRKKGDKEAEGNESGSDDERTQPEPAAPTTDASAE